MPSIKPFELPMLSSSKKRRRDDDHGEMQVPLYGSPKSYFRSLSTNSDLGSRITQHNELTNHLSTINNNERLIYPSGRSTTSLHNMPRKVIPLPVSKRPRVVTDHDEYLHSHGPTNEHSLQQSHLSHAHPEYSTPPTSPQHTRPGAHARAGNQPPLLSPCHICHRKPTKKSDLDSFADCMGCGQRACFVCIRACQGWLSSSEAEANLSASFTMRDVDDDNNSGIEPGRKQRKGGGPDEGWIGRGHREMICSRCCVERGAEGDVVCLGCLAGMEGA
ncbi:hypothetical protein F4804DRAFT_1233 [Jackrogersella minutella]|nr:hypothetical protein F4804DRAFT_1233 [Jackrogersella minutella]